MEKLKEYFNKLSSLVSTNEIAATWVIIVLFVYSVIRTIF